AGILAPARSCFLIRSAVRSCRGCSRPFEGMCMDQNAAICRNVEIVSTGNPPPREPGTPGHHADSRGRGRLAMLWGIAGTVVSALGFIGLSLFDQYNHSLNELQRDIKHFHEVSGSLVKKESLQRCYDRVGECIKELQASMAARAQMERELETAQ